MNLTNEELISYVENGNIDLVNNYIKLNCNGSIQPTTALSIVTRLCNYVSKREITSDVFPEKIYILTNYCCRSINNLGFGSDKYLCCLYYILKFLFNQKSLTYVIGISDHIIAYCANAISTNDDGICKSDIYKHLLALYHKEILQTFKNNDKHVWEKLIIKSLLLHKCETSKQFSTFFSRLSTYCTLFINPEISNEKRHTFCSDVVQILLDIEVVEDKALSDAYNALLSLLHVIVFNVCSYTENDFLFLKSSAEQVLHIMKKLCKSTEYISCINILKYLFNSLFKKLDNRKKNDLILLKSCNSMLTIMLDRLSPSETLTCTYLTRFIKHFLLYFENHVEQWSVAFDSNIQLELFEIFRAIGFIVCRKEKSLAISVSNISGSFVNLSLKSNFNYPDEVHVLNLECLAQSCKYILELKETSDTFMQYWKYIGAIIYNTAISLHNSNRYDLAKSYFYLFSKYIILIEGSAHMNMVFQNAFALSLQLYSNCLTNLKDYKEAMIFLSLLIVLFPDFEEKSLQMFVKIKADKEREHLREITVNKLLEQEENTIKEIYPTYEYNKQHAEHVLLCELHYYFKNWPSKIPMLTVCKELFAVSDNVIVLTKAFNYSWDKVIGLGDSQYLEELEDTFDSLTISDQDGRFIELACLSCLYFIIYKFKTYELLQENVVDMKEASIPLKSNELGSQNDVCDIVPTYYNLKIDIKFDHLYYLNKCLVTWDKLLDCKIFDSKIVAEFNLVKIIKDTAFEFRLQHLYYQMLRAWLLYYKYNKLLEDDMAVIDGIGFIMEFSNCNSKQMQDLELLAEQLFEKLEKSPTTELLDTRVMYHINRSLGLLRSDDLKKSFEEFSLAQKYEQYISISITKARMMHLKNIFLLTACDEQFLCHKENFLLVAQNAFATIADIYKKEGSSNPYLLSTLLDISVSNGCIYKWLHFPREARCYLKESLHLAQTLLLPIRTAQFLSLLAFADLLDKQFADCEVKLDGLRNILNYRSDTNTKEKIKPNIKSERTKLRKMNSLNVLPGIQVLDNPQHFSGSPELQRKSFTLPKMLLHKNSCTCLYCTNFEYHKLIFDVVHLEALINYYANGKVEQTEEYFDGGFLLFNRFTTKYNVFLKNSENDAICKLIYKNLSKPISFSYCRLLLDYSYYLTGKHNFEESEKIIQDLINILKTQKQVNKIFLNEVLYQEINLHFSSQKKLSKEAASPINLNRSYQTYVSATPENKILTTKVSLSVSPVPSPQVPSKKNIKSVKLKFSDSEDDTDETQTKTPKQIKNIRYNLNSTATPAFKVPQINVTPAKIEQPVTSLSSAFNICNSANSKESQSKLKTQTHLTERTKLLTNKLKAETKDTPKTTVKKTLNKTYSINSMVHKENMIPKKSVNEITENMEKLSVDTQKTKDKCHNNLTSQKVYRTRKTTAVKKD